LGKPVVAVRTGFRQAREVKGAGVNLMRHFGATVYAEEQGGVVEAVVSAIEGFATSQKA